MLLLKRMVWLVVAASLITTEGFARDDQPLQAIPESCSEGNGSALYRLFGTKNIWTFILLETTTGRAWQVNFSLDQTPAMKVVLNDVPLLPPGVSPKVGRFTLHPTKNMYNFLLLDRQDGHVWQLQWSFDAKERGIIRDIPLQK